MKIKKVLLILLLMSTILVFSGCIADEEVYTLNIYNLTGDNFFGNCTNGAIGEIYTNGSVRCVTLAGSNCPSGALCEELNMNIIYYYDNLSAESGISYERFET